MATRLQPTRNFGFVNIHSPVIEIANLRAQLQRTREDAKIWRTRFYEKCLEHIRTHWFSIIESSSPVSSAHSIADNVAHAKDPVNAIVEEVLGELNNEHECCPLIGEEVVPANTTRGVQEPNQFALPIVPIEVSSDVVVPKRYSDAMIITQKELEKIKSELVATENKLAAAHINLARRDEMIEKAQQQVVQLREEVNIFYQSNKQLREKLKFLSERHDTFGLFLNKFVNALRELGQDIDDNELILFLADENAAAARIYGDDSAVSRQKSRYLECLIQSTTAAAELRAQEQELGASSSGLPSRVIIPSLPSFPDRGRGRGRSRGKGRGRGRT